MAIDSGDIKAAAEGNGLSRRRLLSGAGLAGAGIAAASAGVLADPAPAHAAGRPGRTPGRPPGAPADSHDFGRMFPGLPPFAQATDTVRAALLEVGLPAGSWTPTTTSRRARRL